LGQYKVSTIDIDKRVTAICTNPSTGTLYYGTSNGVFGDFDGLIGDEKLKGAAVNKVNIVDGLPLICTERGAVLISNTPKNITGKHLDVLDYDPAANILLTTNGIFTKVGNDFTSATLDGIPNYNTLTKGKFLNQGSKKYISANDKLYRYNGKRWSLFTDSIIDVSSSAETMVMLKANGIYKGNKLLFEAALDSTAKVLVTTDERILITNDNFISEWLGDRLRPIYSLNTQEATTIYEDEWHNIWVASGKFLYKVKLSGYEQLPNLKLLRINDAPVKEKVDVKEGKRVKLSYQAYQLTRPQGLRYQTRSSKSDEWSSPTLATSVNFDELKSGSYELQVRATVDNETFTYSPTIKVNVYDRTASTIWWSLLLTGLAILLTAWIGNSRLEKYKSKVSRERKRLLSENKLLALEQKALQLQMNPHFIFNALNSIKGQMAKGDMKEARQSLSKFAHLMRATLDVSRRDNTTLEEEIAYLDRYLELEKWVNQDLFEYEIICDVDQSITIPNMLIQPFVENAVKHAFKGEVKQAKIIVSFKEEGNDLLISVSDNGVGLKSTKENNNHKSVAISVVRDRLNIKFPKASQPLLTMDGVDKLGTQIQLRLPNAAM